MSEETKKPKKKQIAADVQNRGESFVEAAPSESSESTATVEEALDVLFEERTIPLPELISDILVQVEQRVEKLNKETTKDGSKAGVHTHGTRLMSQFRTFRDACKMFVDFLKKEGHE